MGLLMIDNIGRGKKTKNARHSLATHLGSPGRLQQDVTSEGHLLGHKLSRRLLEMSGITLWHRPHRGQIGVDKSWTAG